MASVHIKGYVFHAVDINTEYLGETSLVTIGDTSHRRPSQLYHITRTNGAGGKWRSPGIHLDLATAARTPGTKALCYGLAFCGWFCVAGWAIYASPFVEEFF
jgi:hypothetical protein